MTELESNLVAGILARVKGEEVRGWAWSGSLPEGVDLEALLAVVINTVNWDRVIAAIILALLGFSDETVNWD
jgi:hypothetical protein